jgi:hypothetical protein
MKLINSKSFTATNTVRSAATITVLVFCLSAVRGENLTTLDGRTFTNVVSVTNYSSVVVINHDGGMTGIKPSSLPEDFLSRHGIPMPKKVVSVPQPQKETNQPPVLEASQTIQLLPTPQLDSYLSSHRDSKIEVSASESDNSAGITLNARGFELNAFNFDVYSIDKAKSITTIFFEYGDEVNLNKLFNKFLDWDSIAAKNNAVSFGKPMPISVGTNSFYFYWGKDGTGSMVSSLRLSNDPLSYFEKDHVFKIQKYFNLLPSLKQQLVNKIEQQEAQKELFK